MFPNNTYGNIHISSQGSLQVRGAQKEDDGYFVCSALSVAGSTTSRAYLQVRSCTVSNLLAWHFIYRHFQVTSPFDSSPPPVLQEVPSNQTLPRGSVAMLPCRGSGPTSPKIYWKKNATDITALGSRFSIIQGGTLKIDGKYFASRKKILCKTKTTTTTTLLFEIISHLDRKLPVCMTIQTWRAGWLTGMQINASVRASNKWLVGSTNECCSLSCGHISTSMGSFRVTEPVI